MPYEAYTAGASLLRPMVKKKREINWKQSSNTLSTMYKHSKPQDCNCISRCCIGPERTSVLFQWLAVLFSYGVELMHLLNDLDIKSKDVMRLYVCRLVLL